MLLNEDVSSMIPAPEPRTKQLEASTFCFAQWSFLCVCEFVRCLLFYTRCKGTPYHLLFPSCAIRFRFVPCNNPESVIRSSIHHEIMVPIGHVREVVIVLSLHHDVKISACQELNVVDIIDTAAGLCRDDVCPLRKDRKSTRLNSSHSQISYAVFCLKKKKKKKLYVNITST